MIFEWIVGALVAVMRTLIGVAEGLVPGFDGDGLAGVIGTAMRLNGVLPVSELLSVGGSILAWRALSGPVTAVIARWRLGFKIW